MLLSIAIMFLVTGLLGFLYGLSVMRLELTAILAPPAIVFGPLIGRWLLFSEPFSAELLTSAIFGCMVGTVAGIIFRTLRPLGYRPE